MNENDELKEERRRFPRVTAPVFCRSPRIFSPKRRVSDISPAGVRLYSDEQLDEGKRLEIEFFLPNGYSVVAIAKVVWIRQLPPGSEGQYDIGLEFIHLPPVAVEELKRVLETSSSDS